jgi:hypothetical protein
MSQPQLLEKVLDVLNINQIDYMITGSIVSSLQGEPRATHDIDIVVNIQSASIQNLTEIFKPPQFYISKESIVQAINDKTMFNLIDTTEGDKIDFWILTEEPFDKSRFKRKYNENIYGFDMKVSAPEDTILAKLRWAKLSGGSEKQFTDALRVYEVQYEILDINYINQWVENLQVTELWNGLQQRAQPL